MVLLVAVVILGPKELPRYLRKAGQLAGQLRRMAYDMREKSGIDEVLRTEGIDRDIAEIRKLARGEIADVVHAVRSTGDAVRAGLPVAGALSQAPASLTPQPVASPAGPPSPGRVALAPVDHEYPTEGADSYGALPDTANVYDSALPPSPLMDDPLYVRGDLAAPGTVAPSVAPSPPPSE